MARLVLWILIMLWVTSAWARLDSVFFPALATDEQRLRLLMYARQELPTLFTEAGQYHLDLFEVMNRQDQVRNVLAALPGYRESLEGRSTLLEIEATARSRSTVRATRIQRAAVESWTAQLVATWDMVPEKSRAGLVRAIGVELSALQGYRSRHLLIGLLQALPPDLRQQAFALRRAEDQIEFLSRNLPERMPSGFDFKANGLPASAGRVHALQRLAMLRAHEQALQRLMGLASVLGPKDWEKPKGIRARLLSLGEADLATALDRDSFGPKVDQVVEELRQQKVRADAKPLKLEAREFSSMFGTRTEEVKEVVAGGIRLREVPPSVGIFRGCAGSDCSTQRAFAYVNAPSEKVFIIYDAAGKVKGYLGGAVVEVGGQKSFYLHTMNGPRMSAGDARMAIQALQKSKAELGVHQVALPVASKLEVMINYPAIRGVFQDLISGKSEAPVQFLDVRERGLIEEFSKKLDDATYDHMATNRAAVAIGEVESAGLDVRARPYEPKELQPGRIGREALFEVAIELSAGARSAELDRVLNHGGITQDAVDEVARALKNREGLTLSQHELQMRSTLERHGLQWDFAQSKPHILREGRLRASDAWSSQNVEKTLLDLMNEIRFAQEEGIGVEIVASRGGELFRNHKFVAFLQRMAAGGEEQLALLGSLLRVSGQEIPPSVMQVLRNRALEDSASSLRRAAISALVEGVGTAPVTGATAETVRFLIEQGDDAARQALSTRFFSRPESAAFPELFEALVAKASSFVRQNIVSYVSPKPHSSAFAKGMAELLLVAEPQVLHFAGIHAFRNLQPGDAKLLAIWIERAPQGSLSLAGSIFSRPAARTREFDSLKKALNIRDPEQRKAFLDQTFWKGESRIPVSGVSRICGAGLTKRLHKKKANSNWPLSIAD